MSVQTSTPETARVPLGARKGQKTTTVVLAAVVAVCILAALFLPIFPLVDPASISDRYAVSSGYGPVILAASVVQWLMLLAVVALTPWLLAKNWVAFYVPLAAGFIASIAYWATYGLVRLGF